MTGENQFAVYQMKQTPETRQIRFRSYQTLLEKGIQIRQEDYEQVYTGTLYPQDGPESVRERLDRQPPRSFAGHSVSVSDVLVFHRAGTVISYYVEKTGFIVIENFIKNESSSSGSAVSIDTTNFQIEGKAGSWLAFDSIRLEGQEFFLMEHETYGKEAAWVVVDEAGRLAVDHVRNGFDQEVKRKLEEYLHPSQTEVEEQENPQPHQEGDGSDKPRLDNWQKYMENGEYLRSAEISEEQNYNMIDGRKNNGYKAPSATNSMPPKKKPKGRQSVLAKLHKKQAEIAKRSGKKEHQQSAENDMERERK
ncbi:MAG: DUF4316 domain-containing protein [Lachnospiraceae bacterium]|nr:DUF4316 domain-containing protein [Lachnospiraceae bacterium]